MESWFHEHAAHGIWEDGFGVAVYYAVDVREAFVDLAVDEAL